MSCLYEPLIVALKRDVSTRGFEVAIFCGSALFGLAQDVEFKLLREQIYLSAGKFFFQFKKNKMSSIVTRDKHHNSNGYLNAVCLQLVIVIYAFSE